MNRFPLCYERVETKPIVLLEKSLSLWTNRGEMQGIFYPLVPLGLN